MLCYVTVTSAPGDRPNKARITGIYETEEQARRSLGPDGSPQTSVFQWPMIEPPRFAAPVEIHDGHLVPLQRSRLLDALDNALKREQIARALSAE